MRSVPSFHFSEEAFATVAGNTKRSTQLFYQPDSWGCNGPEIPYLNTKRYNHAVILLQNKFLYVIGGKKSYSTVLCKFTNPRKLLLQSKKDYFWRDVLYGLVKQPIGTPMGLMDRVVKCHPIDPTAWPLYRAWTLCWNSTTTWLVNCLRVPMRSILKYHEGSCYKSWVYSG